MKERERKVEERKERKIKVDGRKERRYMYREEKREEN